MGNHLFDLYSRKHFDYHAVCGVRAGPGLEGPCNSLVVGTKALLYEDGYLIIRPFHKACDEHAYLEQAWLENGKLGTDQYVFELREAGSSVVPVLSEKHPAAWKPEE